MGCHMTQWDEKLSKVEPMQTLDRAPVPSGSCQEPDALERHYSLHEVARLWGISREYARRLFRGRPGVLHLRKPGVSRRREYITLRIPASVLQQVHKELREMRSGTVRRPETEPGRGRQKWIAGIRRRRAPRAEETASDPETPG